MTVGARFDVAVWVPANPAYTTATNAPTPSTPHKPSTTTGTVNRGRAGARSSRGRGHRTASPTNDATRTTLAPHANSQRGIGRGCLPPQPGGGAAAGRTAGRA